MYYNVCPACGAHLDPGERCDCKTDKEKVVRMDPQKIKVALVPEKNGQLRMAI